MCQEKKIPIEVSSYMSMIGRRGGFAAKGKRPPKPREYYQEIRKLRGNYSRSKNRVLKSMS
jgi:hypothetical protein